MLPQSSSVAIIKQAHPDAADSLAQLAERIFRDTFMTENNVADIDLYCAKSFGPESQRRELQDPNYVTILAELEGSLVGFAQVRLNSPKDCVRAAHPSELYRLYVSREWHGRGLSHEIMAEVLAVTARGGDNHLWLGVWEHNPKAIAFYRKYGFSIVGEHTFHLGSDPQRDLIMAREHTRSAATASPPATSA